MNRSVPLTEALPALLRYDVHHLRDIQCNAQYRGATHDIKEDLLLGGFCDVAVHHVGTGALLAPEQARNVEAAVQEVESQQSGHLEGCLEDEARDVGEEQPSIDAPFVLVQLPLVLALSVLSIRHVQSHQQRRGGHHDQLNGP